LSIETHARPYPINIAAAVLKILSRLFASNCDIVQLARHQAFFGTLAVHILGTGFVVGIIAEGRDPFLKNAGDWNQRKESGAS
jgi:hypothetical protein